MARWHTDFSEVRYKNVYPGIDVVYYGQEGRLEYDFVLMPGADPGAIKMSYEGVSGIALDAAGDLLLSTPGGRLTQHHPSIYQERRGKRVQIAGRYEIHDSLVTIALEAFDANAPLVIDPVLSYSTYLGGTGTDIGVGLARDAEGNIFIGGTTSSPGFLNPSGSVLSSLTGSNDGIVIKLNPAGTTRLYTAYIGGTGNENGLGITVDAAGNAYLTGSTDSTVAFPATTGVVQRTNSGRGDAFLAKINPAGTALVFATFLGGSAADSAYGVQVHASGTLTVMGLTESTIFTGGPPSPNPNKGNGDVFALTLSPDASAITGFTLIGGSGLDSPIGNRLDANGNLYIVGETASPDFPTTPGVVQPREGGTPDGFVIKLSPALSVMYSTFLGGTSTEGAWAVAPTPTGTYITGYSGSPNFPTTANAIQPVPKGNIDAFLVKLSPDGSTRLVSTLFGGSLDDRGRAIEVDSADNVYVAGITTSADFPVTGDALQKTNAGTLFDTFAARFGASGTTVHYATYLGGTGTNDVVLGSMLDSQARLHLTGRFNSINFPTTPDAIQRTFGGGVEDMMLIRLELPAPSLTISEVVDGGSLRPQISGGAWVTIKGTNLATGTRIWQNSDFVGSTMPTRLDGTSATMDGKAAAVYFISPGQINVLAPPLARTGPVNVVVTTPQGTASFTATVQERTPSWFLLDPENRKYVAAVNTDGSIVGKTGLFPGAPNATKPLPTNGGVALVYGTGWGATNPVQPEGQAFSGAYAIIGGTPSVKIGGLPAVVSFAGAVSPGLFQFNIVAPNLPPGDYLIEGLINGAATQEAAYITLGPR